MKNFEKPEVEVVKLDVIDVITTSEEDDGPVAPCL
jgi:hypothetical protein